MAKLNRKLYVRVFAVAVLICLISMVGAHVVNTNFGSIEVTDLNIDDSNGNNIACTIYRPKTATSENPAPCVVTLHGSYDSRKLRIIRALSWREEGLWQLLWTAMGMVIQPIIRLIRWMHFLW